jgi:hypothetical protein
VLITGCTNVRMNLIAAKDVISPILWAQYPQGQGMNIDSVIKWYLSRKLFLQVYERENLFLTSSISSSRTEEERQL